MDARLEEISMQRRSYGWLAALLCTALARANDLLPITDFTRHDETGAVEISPDGEYLAMSTRIEGTSRLTFLDLATKSKGLNLQAREDAEILSFHWVSPTRVMYTTAFRYFLLEAPIPTGEIAAADRDGRRNYVVYAAQHGMPTLLSDLERDDRNVLIYAQPWRAYRWWDGPKHTLVVQVDTIRRSAKEIETLPLGAAYPVVDREKRVRFAVGYDAEGKLVVRWRPQADGEWESFELKDFRDRTVAPQGFTQDGRSVLLLATHTDDSLNALYRLDLDSREIEKVYQHPEADIDDVVMDFANEKVIGVRVYADRLEYHWLEAGDPAARAHEMLGRAFPDHAVEITSVTRDHRLAVARVASDVDPGQFYVVDTQARKADFLLASRSWIDPRRMRHMEPIKLEARDGLVLHGYLTRPRDGPGPFPLIVLPHGGPHGLRDVWAFDAETQLFANRGYAVLQLNYRGSGGYGYEFEHAGYREWGAKMQDDLTDATHWAIDQGVTTADNVCVYGASYGGYAALMGAAREPQLYQCAAGYVGVYDLEMMFEEGDIRVTQIGRNYLDEVLGTDVASLRSRSPVTHAGRIEAAILLIHGKVDWRADFKHAKRMRQALESADKEVEWLAFAKEGHGLYDEDNRREAYEALLAFFGKHLHQTSSAEQTLASP
jgi:dipeptidyl aminopeptidase/acylaminoacyl peptidase